jgi:hypothetical protein
MLEEKGDPMNSNVAALARDWLEAKADEAKAQEKRLAIEDQITSALKAKTEGSVTHKIEGYKVTLTQPVTRKVDEDLWASIMDKCPSELHPVKKKIEPDVSGIKWLMENDPTTWAKIAPAFTSKAGKIGVKVEEYK